VKRSSGRVQVCACCQSRWEGIVAKTNCVIRGSIRGVKGSVQAFECSIRATVCAINAAEGCIKATKSTVDAAESTVYAGVRAIGSGESAIDAVESSIDSVIGHVRQNSEGLQDHDLRHRLEILGDDLRLHLEHNRLEVP